MDRTHFFASGVALKNRSLTFNASLTFSVLAHAMLAKTGKWRQEMHHLICYLTCFVQNDSNQTGLRWSNVPSRCIITYLVNSFGQNGLNQTNQCRLGLRFLSKSLRNHIIQTTFEPAARWSSSRWWSGAQISVGADQSGERWVGRSAPGSQEGTQSPSAQS